MNKKALIITVLWMVALSSAAPEGWVSNFTFASDPGTIDGRLYVLSRGDAANGVTVARFSLSSGALQLGQMNQALFEEDYVAVHDLVFADLTGEGRRTAHTVLGSSWILPALSLDSNQSFLKPAGLLRISGNEATRYALEAPERELPGSRILSLAVDGDQSLWIARGLAGIVRIDSSKTWSESAPLLSSNDPIFLFNPSESRLDSHRLADSLDTLNLGRVLALAIHARTGRFWMGTDQGLWRGQRGSMALTHVTGSGLDSARISGVWVDTTGQKLIVESSVRNTDLGKTISEMWASTNGGGSWTAVKFRNSDGSLVNNAYDNLDVSVSAVAFTTTHTWLSVQGIEGNLSGLLRLDSSEAKRWADSLSMEREVSSPWVWGLEAGVVDRDVIVTSVGTFKVSGQEALIATTYGAGVSVSLDSGNTWRVVLNLAPVKAGLGEVRMTPSVMRGHGAVSEVGYRLDKAAKVTIEVLSYDMRKVRTLVRSGERAADPIRSTVPQEDFWDGRDDRGNIVAMGVYYVRVRDNKGHESFGKVMWLGDRK